MTWLRRHKATIRRVDSPGISLRLIRTRSGWPASQRPRAGLKACPTSSSTSELRVSPRSPSGSDAEDTAAAPPRSPARRMAAARSSGLPRRWLRATAARLDLHQQPVRDHLRADVALEGMARPLRRRRMPALNRVARPQRLASAARSADGARDIQARRRTPRRRRDRAASRPTPRCGRRASSRSDARLRALERPRAFDSPGDMSSVASCRRLAGAGVRHLRRRCARRARGWRRRVSDDVVQRAAGAAVGGKRRLTRAAPASHPCCSASEPRPRSIGKPPESQHRAARAHRGQQHVGPRRVRG